MHCALYRWRRRFVSEWALVGRESADARDGEMFGCTGKRFSCQGSGYEPQIKRELLAGDFAFDAWQSPKMDVVFGGDGLLCRQYMYLFFDLFLGCWSHSLSLPLFGEFSSWCGFFFHLRRSINVLPPLPFHRVPSYRRPLTK